MNNAGMVTGKLLMDIPDKLIEKTFEVNTLAHFWVSGTGQKVCFIFYPALLVSEIMNVFGSHVRRLR